MQRTKNENTSSYIPLAARMRPRSLDEFIGQEHVLGKGSPLRQSIEQGLVGSLILWGPPGVGKTTLAYIIANSIDAATERVSAVTAGVADLRAVIGRAKEWQKINRRTVLIVDEIHRFNKAQQDVLLPVVEEGLVTLIGATTENPYFEVVKALVSRAEVVELKGHTDEDIAAIIKRALADKERGLKGAVKIQPVALRMLVVAAGGDARRVLNILDRLAISKEATASGQKPVIAKVDVESAARQAAVQYDKKGDAHYDTISAFIKSLRGSDPDAALFYLFRMLAAGEDPKFIIRRMFIFASEDIGNADPHALMLVSAASRALEWVGLPEAEFSLAHAAMYLAAAPKSNTVYLAKEAAKEDVRLHGNAVPPPHITNAPLEGMKKHGKGVGYKYPHDFPGNVVAQQYRPDVIQNHIYYEPGENGFEKEVKRRIDQARKLLHGR